MIKIIILYFNMRLQQAFVIHLFIFSSHVKCYLLETLFDPLDEVF